MEARQYYQIPQDIYERDGPFEEFKQDGAIVSVELEDGRVFPGVVVLFPNYIISVEGCSDLPFDPRGVVRVLQTEQDISKRSKSDWVWFPHPWSERQE